MKKIRFSVITVVFNAFDTIERTIHSVLSQSFDNYEYIIIDGASTDGTQNIIENYRDKITKYVSEPDNGVYDAMNKGIKVASGEYIVFINANDWFELDALEIIERAIQDNKADILYGLVKKHNYCGECGYMGTDGTDDPERIHFYNIYCHQGLFIRKSLYERLGMYDCNYKVFADYEWILNAHDKGIGPHIVMQVVSNYTMGGLSDNEKYRDEYYQIMLKHYEHHQIFSSIELELKRGIAEFYLLLSKQKFFLTDFVSKKNKIYIWGTGVFGELCYKYFLLGKYSVVGVIDNYSVSKEHWGVPVYTLEQILKSNFFLDDNEACICVASERYDYEMCKQLEAAQLVRTKYISISQFFSTAQLYRCLLKDSE